MSRALRILLCCLGMSLFGCPSFSFGQELFIFAGAASKPPTEEAAKAFEKKTGA